MTVPVSAPGKAFLIGEYAVLEGAPALVTALSVRAVAHDGAGSAAPPTAVVQCAHARVEAYLHGRGVEIVPLPPVVESGGFGFGPRKLGLGSSAAVAAAVVGWHMVQAGLDPHNPAVEPDTLSLALGAHAEAQGGGGSGADVACAVLGGTVRFQGGQAERIEAPSWLELGFVDAGAPAVTSSFIRAVRTGAERHPGAHAEGMARLHRAAQLFERAYGADDVHAEAAFADIVKAASLHCEGLAALGRTSGAPILTPEIERILALAAEFGLAAKPSGAGGGDLVVVFGRRRADVDRFGAELRRRHDLVLLGDLRPDPEGVRPDARIPTNSRLSGFFKLSVQDRRAAVAATTGLPLERFGDLDAGALDVHQADHMIENVVGTFELPLAIATNFRINGRDVLVPMTVEEASVVAAASNAAKMIRESGGFSAWSDPPWMIAQVQLVRAGSRSAAECAAVIETESEALLRLADSAHPRLCERGGGAREIEVRVLAPDMIAVHVLVDCQDAMGANLVNTVAEIVAPRLEAITGWTAGLRILSNLADRRCAHVSARVSPASLGTDGFPGEQVVDAVAAASRFAELDPYRAATHNKGIMNGADAVILATGNDWRAMEASAHAFAARDGRYAPLAVWRRTDDGQLEGHMTLPAAVGVVGGATRVHPVARLALEILGSPSGVELGQIVAAAGLASNLAALRALATEGIQRGHMSLHARSVALEAGAAGPEVEQLARALASSGEVKLERAKTLLQDIRRQTR